MKNILFIGLVLLSVNSFCQNRFEKVFSQADSAFSEKYDLAKFNQVLKILDTCDTAKFPTTTEVVLLAYFSGYINGSLNYKAKGSFDYDNFIKELAGNKRSIESYKRFLKRTQ